MHKAILIGLFSDCIKDIKYDVIKKALGTYVARFSHAHLGSIFESAAWASQAGPYRHSAHLLGETILPYLHFLGNPSVSGLGLGLQQVPSSFQHELPTAVQMLMII